MRVLLDTHVFLWWVYDDPKLGKSVRDLIYDTANTKLVSAVSAWELAIKAGLGKIRLDQPVSTFFTTYTSSNYFEVLSISLTHIYQTEYLPPHHKDPFDKLLIAQAKSEGLQIVSADTTFDAYEIERVW